jgi:peptidoglycan/LPS O-acetylase OafA/YrhL
MTKNKSGIFFPNLDGPRFFCFLSVFLFHSFATGYQYIIDNPVYHFIKSSIFGNGNLGVNFFFVLSGFLITYLLIFEKFLYGTIHIGNFYIRRILRIWPLYFFCVFFGFVIFPFFKKYMGFAPNETATPIYYILFINNFEFVRKGLPDSSVLSILWSVAIEEQFYLVWPLLISFLQAKHLPYVFMCIFIFSFLFRFIHANNPIYLEHHTFSCISDMCMGGTGAYLAIYSSRFKDFIVNLKKPFIIILYAATAVIYFFRQDIFHYNELTLSADRLIVSVFFVCIILEQNFSKNSFFKFKSLRRITKLGQYTYGLYCLHMIGILIVAILLRKLQFNTKVWQVLLVEGSLSLAITILLAFISYHFFEKRFLKLKNKFAFVSTKSGSSQFNERAT